MEKITWRGGAMLAPLPVCLVTCRDGEKENVFTVAWTGILNTIPAKTYISVRKERFSYELIKNSREFVLNLTTEALARATDFCGVRSGRDMDKFKEMQLKTQKATEVGCPLLSDSPVNLECKVTDIVELGSHDMFIADIVAVDVDKNLVDENEKLNLDKAKLIAYSHGEYFKLGEKIGKFGYTVKKN
ncbi:MAG: flavin reductase family protein [Clostridia bacterium]|nr:flavin reductase family protein [Clostridia bacterium]